jgi:hypothetical protein
MHQVERKNSGIKPRKVKFAIRPARLGLLVNKPAQAPSIRNILFKLAEMIPKIAYFEHEERG